MASLPNTPNTSGRHRSAPTYYDLLGIESSATEQEVRKAWLRKSLETHPDRNPDDDTAHEAFQNIKEAYETLFDESKRAHYDHCLAMGLDHKTKFPPVSAPSGPTGGGFRFGFGFGFTGPMGGQRGGWGPGGGHGSGSGGFFPWGGGMNGMGGGGRYGGGDDSGPSGHSNHGDEEQDHGESDQDEHRTFGWNETRRQAGPFGGGGFQLPPFEMMPPFGFFFGLPNHPLSAMGHGRGMNQYSMHHGRGMGMGMGYHPSVRGREWSGQFGGMRGGFGTLPGISPNGGFVQGGEEAMEWGDDQPHIGARAFPPMFGFGGSGQGQGQGPATMFPPRGRPARGIHQMHTFPPGINPSNIRIQPRAPFQRPSSPSFRSASPPIMPSHPRPMSPPRPDVRFGPGPHSSPSTLPQTTPFPRSARGSSHHSQQAFPSRPQPPPPRMPFRSIKPEEIALQNALMMLAQTKAINLQTQMMVGHLLRERFGYQGRAPSRSAPTSTSAHRPGDPTTARSAAMAADMEPTLLITHKRQHDESDAATEIESSPPKRPRSADASSRDDPSSVLRTYEEEEGGREEAVAGKRSTVSSLFTSARSSTSEGEAGRPILSHPDELSVADADHLINPNNPVDTHEVLDHLLDLLGLSAGQFMSLAKAGKMEEYLAKRKGEDGGVAEALLAANTQGITEALLAGDNGNVVTSSAATL